MNRYFSGEFNGPNFTLFSGAHLIAIAIIGGITVLIILLNKFHRQRCLELIRYILIIIIPMNEISWHVWAATLGTWSIKESLPLHLCSMMIWISPLLLISKNQRLFEFMYFLGIGGSIQAIFTPNLDYYNFPHFRFFQTFIAHGGIFITAIFLTVVDGLRPGKFSGIRVFATGNLLMIIIFFINRAIGSNYMWISGKPGPSSILDYLGPWPWYILGIEGFALLTIMLLSLPFYRGWKTGDQ